MLRLAVATFFIISTSFVFGQKYSFVTFSTEQGLPQSQVTAISQDDLGYLWVGTLGGLAKFNGNEFTTFSSNDGLLNNRVTTLNFFDQTLWVGHDGGISFIHNNEISNVAFLGNDKSRNVSDIINFKGHLFVCSNGGGLFELIEDSLVNVDLGELDYLRIRKAYVANDVLYLATRGGILTSKKGLTFNLLDELGVLSFSGVHGKNDEIVFSTYNDGVYKKNLSTGLVSKYSSESVVHSVFGCYMDNTGETWLNTQQGVVRIHSDNSISFLDNNNGLPVNMIGSFFEDSDNNMWIGSQGKGVFRFPGAMFKYFDQSTGFPTGLFLNGFQKSNGDFFFGTYDKGVVLKTKEGVISPVNVFENTIWTSIQNVNGKDWFGTQSSLVSIDSKGNVISYDLSDNLPGSKITALYKLSKNSMYVGGSEGLAIYKNNSFSKLGSIGSEFIGTVRDIEIVHDSLYCATNLGVFIYRNGDFELLGNTRQVVYNLEKDNKNNLWFGSEEGLFRLNDNVIEKIELLDDPASNYINFLNYRKGEMFVGTNNGLFILTELTTKKPRIKRYGIDAGIVDLETNLNSGFFDNDGNFWFGTALGLVCYHSNIIQSDPSAPLVNLKSILLNYQPFDYSIYSKELTDEGIPKKLILPNSKNNLIFELDGVSVVHHRGLKYQFYLEGSSEGWSPLSDIPIITFTNLPAGEYNLRMRAADIDGRLSSEVILPFTIKEAFYKTWWFIGFSLLFLSLIIILVFRVRLRRVKELGEKEKLIYKARLLQLEQKSVNASMNRHFIFNALNSIQYFINTQDRLSANKYLTNFAQLIRKNLDSASAEGNRITLEEELERLKLYLSLESMRFNERFDYTIKVQDVDPMSIKIPAMIMQPFIENSIIHGILPNESKKGDIHINIFEKDNYLNISIEDNGIGVNQSRSRKVFSVEDHKSHGMEITSKRIELIQKIYKDDISLEGPTEILNKDSSIKGTYVLIKIPLHNLDI